MSSPTHQSDAEIATLVISGRFDAHQVTQVQQELDALLAASARYIILDLSDVSFVDSSALAVMVRGMKRCRERNGDLLLCGLRQPLRIIFELTRMDRAFRIYENQAAAQSSLAGS